MEDYKLNRKLFHDCCDDMLEVLKLCPSAFLLSESNKGKQEQHCPFTLDAFTFETSAQLNNFWTPESDAFKQDWQGETLWVHPPYSMASQVWIKIKSTPHFTGCVFLPEWYTQVWFFDFADSCTCEAKPQFLFP